VHEGLRDAQLLGPVLEQHELTLGILAQHARDRVEVDDRAAMDLAELLRIEVGRQILERRANECRPAPTNADRLRRASALGFGYQPRAMRAYAEWL
jgi:hypothetical protein